MQNNSDKYIAILANSLAGSGQASIMAEKICQQLKSKQIAYLLFQETWPNGFENFTDIFIVGGDGTLNYFINRYPGIQLPMAVFNGGTGNDFHWLLYKNQTLDEQLNNVLTAAPKPVDVGKCNELYFINGVGIGFEGEVARALTGKKKRPGKTSFFLTILKKVFVYRSKTYNIQSNEKNLSGKKLLVDINDGQRAGGGFHVSPEASADDGLFDIVIADALTSFRRLLYLPVIEKGRHLKLSFIHHFRVRKITVESPEMLQFHLDGEYCEATRLEIEIVPGALNFLF